MFQHYLLMAARGFERHKLYSFINVAGLSVALTCTILILLFVRDQLSWDDWISGTAHLYRLEETAHLPGGRVIKSAECPFPVLTAVGREIPGVKAVTHVLPEAMTITAGARQFHETVTVVDPDFLQVIRLPLMEGDPARVLAQPESVVLSRSEARKYFGDSDPIGKSLRVSGLFPDECKPGDAACYSRSDTLTVTGVLRDLPHNTQLVADFVVPNTSGADELSQVDKERDWTATDGDYGYVELDAGAAPRDVLAALNPIIDRSFDPRRFGVNLRGSQTMHFDLTPFREVHLTSDQYGGMTPGGSRTTVAGFAAIAILIVLVACCNLMNLATARATLRAKEIGLRKIAGATRQHIMIQFLVEAVVTALVALAIALALAEILLPAYGRLLGSPLAFHYLVDWKLLIAVIAAAIVVGLLSGLYPAAVLSAFRPASTLNASVSAQTGSGWLRSALVVGQFAVSIGLGIAVIVVFREIDFVRTMDWGFRRDGVIVLPNISQIPPTARQALARILRNGPGITGAALSNAVPFAVWHLPNYSVGRAGMPGLVTTSIVNIAPEFPALYGLKLRAGRLLSTAHGGDTQPASGIPNVLINAQAASQFGYTPREAIGKLLLVPGPGSVPPLRLNVVGVLGDAKIGGFRDTVEPAILIADPEGRVFPSDRALYLSVGVRSDRTGEAISFVDRTWRTFAPGKASQRYFLDGAFAELFAADEQQGVMFSVFVGIAIIIASLGLFGLAVFTTERRTKEVGVRKIAGARVANIVRLLLWRISVPVLIANVVAWPVAYHYLQQWLDGYAYRITLSPFYFLIAGAGALLMAWGTVFAHTLRLARSNPVHALRYE
jgi:putative ABC transport system permease protein